MTQPDVLRQADQVPVGHGHCVANGARQGRAATAMKALEDGAARQDAEVAQRTLGRNTLEDAHGSDGAACPIYCCMTRWWAALSREPERFSLGAARGAVEDLLEIRKTLNS